MKRCCLSCSLIRIESRCMRLYDVLNIERVFSSRARARACCKVLTGGERHVCHGAGPSRNTFDVHSTTNVARVSRSIMHFRMRIRLANPIDIECIKLSRMTKCPSTTSAAVTFCDETCILHARACNDIYAEKKRFIAPAINLICIVCRV